MSDTFQMLFFPCFFLVVYGGAVIAMHIERFRRKRRGKVGPDEYEQELKRREGIAP